MSVYNSVLIDNSTRTPFVAQRFQKVHACNVIISGKMTQTLISRKGTFNNSETALDKVSIIH